PLGYAEVFGLAFWAGSAFGFSAAGQLFEVTFDGDALSTTPIPIPDPPAGLEFWGAGSTTSAPPLPEPKYLHRVWSESGHDVLARRRAVLRERDRGAVEAHPLDARVLREARSPEALARVSDPHPLLPADAVERPLPRAVPSRAHLDDGDDLALAREE